MAAVLALDGNRDTLWLPLGFGEAQPKGKLYCLHGAKPPSPALGCLGLQHRTQVTGTCYCGHQRRRDVSSIRTKSRGETGT